MTADRGAYRIGSMIDGGIEPSKAVELSAMLSELERTATSQHQVVDSLLTTVARLTDQGMGYYEAFTALFCHPSEHENYAEIAETYFASKEAVNANDPKPQ